MVIPSRRSILESTCKALLAGYKVVNRSKFVLGVNHYVLGFVVLMVNQGR